MKTIRNIFNQNGAAAVEFAIVLPLLVLFVFGIIEFGILFYDKALITNATREAARAAILYRDPRPDVTLIENVASSYFVDESGNSKLITFNKPSSTPIINVPEICNNSGDEVSVEILYNYHFLIIPDILAKIFKDQNSKIEEMSDTGIMIGAITKMRCE